MRLKDKNNKNLHIDNKMVHPNSLKNLTKPITNSEQARAMGKKGGAVKSEAKKLAAKLRELRRKGLTKDSAKVLLGLLECRGLSDLDVLQAIKGLSGKGSGPVKDGKKVLTLDEQAIYSRLMMAWRRTRFGSGPQVEKELEPLGITSIEVTFVLPDSMKSGMKEVIDVNHDEKRGCIQDKHKTDCEAGFGLEAPQG